MSLSFIHLSISCRYLLMLEPCILKVAVRNYCFMNLIFLLILHQGGEIRIEHHVALRSTTEIPALIQKAPNQIDQSF